MCASIRAAMLALLVALPAVAAEPQRPSAPQAPPRPVPPPLTAKERLSGKASDEQRVDDCKVPAGRRTHERPVGCPWDVGC